MDVIYARLQFVSSLSQLGMDCGMVQVATFDNWLDGSMRSVSAIGMKAHLKDSCIDLPRSSPATRR
jgi:hypothetical protein